jgi:hypothetical protein
VQPKNVARKVGMEGAREREIGREVGMSVGFGTAGFDSVGTADSGSVAEIVDFGSVGTVDFGFEGETVGHEGRFVGNGIVAVAVVVVGWGGH